MLKYIWIENKILLHIDYDKFNNYIDSSKDKDERYNNEKYNNKAWKFLKLLLSISDTNNLNFKERKSFIIKVNKKLSDKTKLLTNK
jgi:hypothetical protein